MPTEEVTPDLATFTPTEVLDVSSTEVEHVPTTAALATRGDSPIVMPAAPVEVVRSAFENYQAVCHALLDDDDYQSIGQRRFRKKSAWRKLAVAFDVSCVILDRIYERDDRGRVTRAEVVTRAQAPNGRTMDGLGACDYRERCCPAFYGYYCRQADWRNHTCCGDDCDGFRHFSKPEHDIPATASTRATNRACADLFGMGEVSAEEMPEHGDYNEYGHYEPRAHQSGRRAQPVERVNPDDEHAHSLGFVDFADHETLLKEYARLGLLLTEGQRVSVREWRDERDFDALVDIPKDALVELLAFMAALLEEPF